jgi:3-dehydroquinate dehydratase/shikimate dehydrogenase
MNSPRPISPAAYLRTHTGKVCVALQGKTVAELLSRAEAALPDSHFLEFRLDSIQSPDTPEAAVKAIDDFLTAQKDVVAVATCRRKANGGGFTGSLLEELNVLALASECGFGVLDLEIESAEEADPDQIEALRSTDSALMISFHNFESASDPDAALTRIEPFAPDFVKIVTTARSLADSSSFLQWLHQRSGEAQIVGIAMGEAGVLTRILSLRAGSAFTFASATEGTQTAPGQITARSLKDLYRVDQLDQATRIYGVAGNPVAHSLSPLMQNTAFRRERVNAVYLPLKTESIEDLLALARQLPLSGLSVTMPFKQSIMPHLANVDPMTAKLGACNTIRMGADGKLYGFNTDVAGVIRPLEKRLPLKNARVVVLGAGGAARAAVFGLAEKGANVYVCSRNEASVKELAAKAGVASISRKKIADNEFDVLINATPCGMTGHTHPLPLEPEEWKARLVFDLVYNPLETPLIRSARHRGVPTIQGVEMFVQQGARQFELWTGKPAPEAEMHRVVVYALNKAQAH